MLARVVSSTAWLSDVASTRQAQFIATAVVSASTAVGIVFVYQNISRRQRTQQLKAQIPPLPHDVDGIKRVTHYASIEPQTSYSRGARYPPVSDTSQEDERSTSLAIRARQGDYDDDLILEQLARNRVFLKDDGLRRVRNAFVVIVGCGGVGSHAAAALARSGVSRIRLIDFDQVTLSSLNRHSLATLADVGTPKVQCIRKRLEQITPWVQFDCRNELFSKEVAGDQLAALDGTNPDYIVDAIDNIDSKVDLLHYCYQHRLPVISSMGAGCKSDPTRVIIGDISASMEDPLSRSTRRRLKLLGVGTGVPVVFSTEKSSPEKAHLLPLPEEEFVKGDVKDLSVMQDFRVRILPVLGTMPAVFGLSVANHILLELGQYPHEYLPTRYRDKLYDTVVQNTQGLEERLVRHKGMGDARGLKLPLTTDDVAYLVEEVYRGRSIVSGIPTRLALVRWTINADEKFPDDSVSGQKASSLKLSSLVCMTKEEAARHEKEVLMGDKRPEDLYSRDIIQRVQNRMHYERSVSQYR